MFTYTEQIGGLYFYIEHLLYYSKKSNSQQIDEERFEYWKYFIYREETRSRKYIASIQNQTDPRALVDITDGLRAFESIVLKSFNYGGELFICLASEKLWDQMTYDDIVIYVSLRIEENTPVSTHMGIQKSFSNLLINGPTKYPKLSMKLHGFAARFTQKFHPHVIYMMTWPVPSMKKIFEMNMQNIYISNEHMDPDEAQLIYNSVLAGEKSEYRVIVNAEFITGQGGGRDQRGETDERGKKDQTGETEVRESRKIFLDPDNRPILIYNFTDRKMIVFPLNNVIYIGQKAENFIFLNGYVSEDAVLVQISQLSEK